MEFARQQAYLARLGLHLPIDVSPEGLAQLHLQHMRTVVFENLSYFLGERIDLTETALLAKLIDQRRGGFCYELNGAFFLLLRALGFDVSLLSARVFDGEHLGPPFDHLLLRVRFASGDYLADVGFGEAFQLPLALSDEPCLQSGVGYRLWAQHGMFVLQQRQATGPWQSLYQFDLQARAFDDFAHMCTFHQRSPASPFSQRPLCSLARPDGRITLSGLRLIITLGADRLEQPIGDSAGLGHCLHKHFGIDLDDHQRMQLFQVGNGIHSDSPGILPMR